VAAAVVLIVPTLVDERLSHHRAQAKRTAQSTTQRVVAPSNGSSSGPRGILDDRSDATPERVVDDHRSGARDVDPFRWGLLDDTTPSARPGPTNGDALGAPIHGASGVGLVHEDAAHGDWVPLATRERGDTRVVQFATDGGEAPGLGIPLEDPPHDAGLVGLDIASSGFRVVGVPVASLPERLRDLAAEGALGLAARGALQDLFALNLGNEGTRREDEAPDRGVLETLRHEFELRLRSLELVEEDADVVLIPGQAVDGVGDDRVGFTAPEHAAELFESVAFERCAAGRVTDPADDPPAAIVHERLAGAFLCLERGPVALLRVSRDSRVDDRSHRCCLRCLPMIRTAGLSSVAFNGNRYISGAS